MAQVKVPKLAGLARADAETALTNAKLVVNTVTTANANVPAGNVIDTKPPADTTVDEGSTVNLEVSSGPAAQVKVPNLAGSAQADAETALKNAGLSVGAITTAASARTR